MRISRRAVLSGAVATVLSRAGWARETRPAPSRYTITPLPLLPGGDYSSVYGINNRGQAVGLASTGKTRIYGMLRDTRAVLWEQGQIHDLVGKRYDAPHAFRINERGQVLIGPQYIGSSHPGSIPAPEPYVLLWEGTVQQVWRLAQDFEPENLNDRGEIVGRTLHSMGDAAVWRQGQMHRLPQIKNTDSSQALAINDAGGIIGIFTRPEDQGENQLFVHYQGTTRWIRPRPGHTDFYPSVITPQGVTVGLFREAATRVAHLFTGSDDTYADHGAIGRNGQIGDANRLEQIVGATDRGAFLYQNGRIYDLIHQIAPEPGWELYTATGINDHGQIVGNGTLHGQFRAFLLTPQ